MVAMNDLARQIAAKQPARRASEHVATVVGKDAQGTYWVSIPGGAERTPVATALTEASAGDTVMVAISDGRCIMSGNVSSPGASTRSVSKVGAVANMAMTTAYSEKARIDELSTTALTAQSALITELQADTAKVHDLTAEQIGAATAYVGALSAGDVTAQDIIAAQGTIENLDSNYAHITNGVIDNAAIGHADVSGLSANYAHITSGVIDNATIGHADVNGLAANYAEIDGANIDTAAIRDAWVDNLLVSTGLLANDGTVFTLDAVQVDAANITTGTLDVRRLIITRTEGGVDQKYLVEIDSTTGNPSYVKMDGDVLGPHTVSADKLVAHSITASEITTQNLAGTNGWINLASGTFAYGNPLTGQGITWNGSALEIQGSVHVGGSSKQLADMLTSNDITVSQNQTQTGYDVDIAGNTFSLVNGEDGQPGATGPQGPQGIQGETGPQGVSVTNVTSTNNTSDGGTSVVTVTLSDGTTKTFNVKNGSKGSTGDTAQWYYGTALTHTSGTATLATSSTAGVVIGAMYLNTATSLCYKCTAISGSTATWTYAGNLTDGVIDNINVGGRNLLLQSQLFGTAGKTNRIVGKYSNELLVSRADGFNEIQANAKFRGISVYADSMGFAVGEKLILSTNVRSDSTVGTNLQFYCMAFNASGTRIQTALLHLKTRATQVDGAAADIYANGSFPAGAEERIIVEITWLQAAQDLLDAGGNIRFTIQATSSDWSKGNVAMWAPKLERGNVATDWTPAPEDMASASTGVYYATCSTAAGTAVKVATTEQSGFMLVPGAMVNVKFTATNSAAVANLKLNVNETGDKPIKYIYNNSLSNLPGVGYLLADNMYTFRYDGTNWVVQLMYNTNTDTNARYTQYYNSIITGEALANASLIGAHEDGKYYQLAGSGDYFVLTSPLLWLTTALASGATNYANIYTQTYDRNLATYYTSFNTGAANSIVYLVGTVSGNVFMLHGSTSATYLSCNIPTSEGNAVDSSGNRLFYIPIGRLGNQSNGKNYFNFQVSVPVSLYAFLDGKFRQVTPTEVVSEQYVYCQSDTVLDVPSVPSAWVSETGESVSEDEGMRSNYLVGTEIPLEMTANYQNVYELSTSIQTLATDEDITVTFKAKADIARWIDFYFVAGSTDKNNTSNFYPAFHLTTDWAWYTYSGPAGADIASVTAFRLRQNASQHASGTTGATIEVSDLMLTRGGAIVGPLWTTKRPTYRKLYPVTFVAKQTKRLDGTITCTTPIPDDTTTVIDGGRIITGTVDASVVNVVNLNADNITSGTIDAQRIRSGSITVSMFSDDVSEKFALTENVEESLADMGDAISDMGSDLGGQISAVSANAQAAASTAEAASTMAASLDATVNGTSSTAGLVDRMRNVETHINLTTIGQGADSQPAIILDASGGNSSGMEAVLTNTQLAFRDNGETVSYISNRKQYITDLEVTSEAQFGNFAFIPMSDGSLAFKWVG